MASSRSSRHVLLAGALTAAAPSTATCAAASAWELRWETQPDQIGASVPPFNSATGDLAQLNQRPVSTLWSPRLVAPDGSCTIYLYPFYGTSEPRVAVVGDSLLLQLNNCAADVGC